MKIFNLLRKLIVFLAVTLSQLSPLFSQEDKSPFLSPEELNGGETLRSDVFDGNSLWGYINGGADIYLEYGFKHVQLQEILYRANNYKIEIYRMRDVEAAYGIFSVSTFRCDDHEPLNDGHYCETRYQIQFARGENYVSITNETGNEDGVAYNQLLASKIELKTEEMSYVFPALFQHELFRNFRKKMKLIKGNLGLQNGFAFWSGKFDFRENYKMMILPMGTDEGEVNLAIIEFLSPGEREEFCVRNNLHYIDSGKSMIRRSDAVGEYSWNYGINCILFLESSIPREAAGRYIRVIEEFLSN
jgi:hypothetical protein